MRLFKLRTLITCACLGALLLFVGTVRAQSARGVISFGWAMADSIYPEYSYHQIVGYNSAIADGAREDITELGVNVTPTPTITDSLRVVSNSGSDSAASTGALTIEIDGLDTNWDEQSETVTMTGTDTVVVANFYRRINNMHVLTAGSGGVAAGNIVLTNGAGTATYAKIVAGGNASLEAFFTIPAGKKGFITGWSAGSAGNNGIRFDLRATADWNDRSLVSTFQFQDIIVQKNGTTYVPFPVPIEVPAKCDIKISGRVITTGNAEGAAAFYLYYK